MADQTLRDEQQPIPNEIDRWNWGAFLLHWIWGIGNNTYIALLVFIPFFGILIMPFVLGAKGSVWAWRNGRWDSVAHFKRVQRLWAIWGVIIWVATIGLFGAIFGGTTLLLKNSDAYKLGVAKLEASPEAVNILGTPISAGLPSGSVNFDGQSGAANLNFSVTGQKAAGRLFVEATKKFGVWTLESLKLKVDGQDQVIDLLQQTKVEMDRRPYVTVDGSTQQMTVTLKECDRSRSVASHADPDLG
jgi:hypothetical protein